MEETSVGTLVSQVQDLLDKFGYECAPFQVIMSFQPSCEETNDILKRSFFSQVAWYNEMVSERFRLNYLRATLALSVISAPRMYEDAFLPFVETHRHSLAVAKDPLDQCTQHHLEQVKVFFQERGISVDIIYDFDVHPNRQPRVLVQTAGHVAGQARYYQRCDVDEKAWHSKMRIYGSSAHPRYGGWFAFRGVMIFRDIQALDLQQTPPPDVLPTNELRCDFLERFTFNWKDWSFRDVPVNVEQRYSDAQKQYFETNPRERHQLFGLPDPWKTDSDGSSDEEGTPSGHG